MSGNFTQPSTLSAIQYNLPISQDVFQDFFQLVIIFGYFTTTTCLSFRSLAWFSSPERGAVGSPLDLDDEYNYILFPAFQRSAKIPFFLCIYPLVGTAERDKTP
jgi:hypothetical protein